MSLRPVSAHPACWQFALIVLESHAVGSIGKARTAIRVLDALTEKVPLSIPQPNPFKRWTDEERAAWDAKNQAKVDPEARVTVNLSQEGCDVLKEVLEKQAATTAVHQARFIVAVLDAIETKAAA